MPWKKIIGCLTLAAPWWLVAALSAAEIAPTATTASTTSPPKSAPVTFTHDNLQMYMQSPVAPTRSHAYKGDDGNAPYLKPETAASETPPPVTVSTKPANATLPLALKPKPGSNDDRLAVLAVEDRDFFAALTKNPQAWTEAERDQHAQLLHDQYWLYIAEYPNDVNALVLYGKLLNRTGQRDAAFTAFLHADELDPKIAVVKQQLANHLAEDGNYATALDYFRKAVALAPGEPLYHYQIGELLNFFYEGFLKDKIFSQAELNKTMEAEFGYAAALAPKVPAYAWRHALSYYNMLDPDWNAALKVWVELAGTTSDTMELEVIRLHRGRILIELARYDDARQLLAQPVQKNLEAVRAALSRRLEETAAPKLNATP